MGQIITYLAFAATLFAALRHPWIGVAAGYTFVLMLPHEVWPWNFDGIRFFKMVAIPTLIGTMFAALSSRLDYTRLKSKLCLLFMLWCLFMLISYWFGPYVDVVGRRVFDPETVVEAMLKSFLFFYVGVMCIDNDKKLKLMVHVAIASVIVLTWWANNQYLTGQMYARLNGPGGKDSNGFAAMLVVLLPFLWYYGLYTRNLFLRFGLWLVIPFGWHAVFLTSSRGGLVGIAVTLLFVSLRSKRSRFALLALPVFAVVYVWQAGSIMQTRATTIDDYQTESSAASRLKAWGAATNMMAAHPITGVGLASFVTAFSNYSEDKPRVAHNTFFQIAGESGVIAGLSWLGIVTISILGLWRKPLPRAPTGDSARFVSMMNDATLVAMVGFGACAMFLSVQGSEIFFFLGILANYLLLRQVEEGVDEGSVKHSPAKDRKTVRVPIRRMDT